MREQDNPNVAPQSERPATVVEIDVFRRQRLKELLEQARVLMIEGRDEEAFVACEEALRICPDSELALALAGTLAAVQGENREGLCLALQLVQLDPTEADGYYEVAMCLLDLGYPEESLAWLETGHQHMRGRDDDLVDFFSAAQAEALALLCRYEEAEAALRAACEQRGDDLGMLGDAAERVEWLRRRFDC